MTPCLKLDMSNKQDDDEEKNDEVSNRLKPPLGHA